MLLKNLWWKITSITENPTLQFLFMFIGVVPGTLFLFAVGVNDFQVLPQPNVAWSLLPLAILVSTSIAMGYWRFGRKPVELTMLAARSQRT
jgi:hypothetical protein